ncbi:hypothetical protein [Dolichospermum flos-aquae]|nr:hypothetical protein [Dolichospermum flos-aquae]
MARLTISSDRSKSFYYEKSDRLKSSFHERAIAQNHPIPKKAIA